MCLYSQFVSAFSSAMMPFSRTHWLPRHVRAASLATTRDPLAGRRPDERRALRTRRPPHLHQRPLPPVQRTARVPLSSTVLAFCVSMYSTVGVTYHFFVWEFTCLRARVRLRVARWVEPDGLPRGAHNGRPGARGLQRARARRRFH